MTTLFFSEIGSPLGTKFPRNFPNMRTDCSWAVAINAPVFSFNSSNFSGDLGIMIVPKKNPQSAFEFFERNRVKCKYWSVMQEGHNIGWQDYSVPDQIQYVKLLNEVDLIFCHNGMDKRYFDGLIPNKNVAVLSSLMISDAIPDEAMKVPQNRNNCLINGNWTSWYSAQDSFFVAQEFGCEIFAPSMGRKQEYEDYIEDITYFPYMNWSQWMIEVNEMKYGVNLMRTFAAGTFSLNLAHCGIPCIGWDYLDTQRVCFPNLSIPVGDMVSARFVAKLLKNDVDFYNECATTAQQNYWKYFSETKFVQDFLENTKHLHI